MLVLCHPPESFPLGSCILSSYLSLFQFPLVSLILFPVFTHLPCLFSLLPMLTLSLTLAFLPVTVSPFMPTKQPPEHSFLNPFLIPTL